jgi:transcriptional regulator with XRE-family HTH domain
MLPLTPLRQRRLELGLTQNQLGRRAGVLGYRVSLIERLEVDATAQERRKLAAALDVEANVLFPLRAVEEIDAATVEA